LVIVEQDGSSRQLESPAELPLSDNGVVLPDGTIAVATLPAGVLSLTPRYVDVWAFSPTDTPARKLTEGYKFGITAFGFVSASVLKDIPGQIGAPMSPTRIYLSRSPESEEDFSAVFPVVRRPMTPVEALNSVIAGPTAEEVTNGYYSELGGMLLGDTTCDGDFQLTMEGDTANVQFCRDWSSAGIGQDARVSAQVSATLTQFPTIHKVRLLSKDGHCLTDMSGLDLCLRQ
jgi:hypothetical protein